MTYTTHPKFNGIYNKYSTVVYSERVLHTCAYTYTYMHINNIQVKW